MKLAAFIILFLPLIVQGKALPSSVNGDLKADTTNTTDFNLDGDIFLLSRSHILAGFEKTQGPNVQGSPDDLDTKELRLGFGSDPQRDWNYTVNYALWGQQGQIGTNTFSFNSIWILKDWTFNVEPGLRLISIFFSDQVTTRRRNNVTFSDPFVGVGASYLGLDNWTFKLNGTFYHYALDLNDFSSPQFSKFFSRSAITLSSSFSKYTVGFIAAYDFPVLTLAAEISNAIAQIDDSSSVTCDLKAVLFFIKAFDITVSVGQTSTPSVSTTVNFASLGGTFYWM